ncbi:MAG: hypothetical protein AAF587_05565 [Bacteroidota bacterium]
MKRLRHIATILLSLLLLAATLYILMDDPSTSVGQDHVAGNQILDGALGMIKDSLSTVIHNN